MLFASVFLTTFVFCLNGMEAQIPMIRGTAQLDQGRGSSTVENRIFEDQEQYIETFAERKVLGSLTEGQRALIVGMNRGEMAVRLAKKYPLIEFYYEETMPDDIECGHLQRKFCRVAGASCWKNNIKLYTKNNETNFHAVLVLEAADHLRSENMGDFLKRQSKRVMTGGKMVLVGKMTVDNQHPLDSNLYAHGDPKRLKVWFSSETGEREDDRIKLNSMQNPSFASFKSAMDREVIWLSNYSYEEKELAHVFRSEEDALAWFRGMASACWFFVGKNPQQRENSIIRKGLVRQVIKSYYEARGLQREYPISDEHPLSYVSKMQFAAYARRPY